MKMKEIIGVIVFSAGLLITSYRSYVIWFKPKQYLEFVHKSRLKYKSLLDLPDWIIGYFFLYEQPFLTIWLARIAYTFGIVICILGIIASISS
jgi:hypothetical protein